jgi:hypothetical protein
MGEACSKLSLSMALSKLGESPSSEKSLGVIYGNAERRTYATNGELVREFSLQISLTKIPFLMVKKWIIIIIGLLAALFLVGWFIGYCDYKSRNMQIRKMQMQGPSTNSK